MALTACINCGTKVSDKANICPKCGCMEPYKKTVLKQCPECNNQIAENSEICPECGYPEPFKFDISSSIEIANDKNDFSRKCQIIQQQLIPMLHFIKIHKQKEKNCIETNKNIADKELEKKVENKSETVTCPKCGCKNVHIQRQFLNVDKISRCGFLGAVTGGIIYVWINKTIRVDILNAIAIFGIFCAIISAILAFLTGDKGKLELTCVKCGYNWFLHNK